ncbi:hypothetical protein FAM09_11550 [Niastella caeni]|uniref:Uncharacterized protein n=1 Tax=Niastella caeni TaxID=2569763 RepID=A0A4S8I1X8_9BACT|nr:hypothetical protein FAM09_11550 [Niastella caeni]
MGKINKQKIKAKSKVASNTSVSDYANDPYFVKKRKMATEFLKKVGLPESYITIPLCVTR